MHKINLPKNVAYILNTLENNGFKAFVVGGCVRDSLLLKNPNDWDITTSAKPDEIKRLFKRTIDTGIKHGTISVVLDDAIYEVTTFRKDGDYIDGRHPESVEYTDDLVLDLSRRDFTINAMAYNEKQGLVDPFFGAVDLENSIIRCVGNPVLRFSEDALRMLRAVRFSAQLSFNIEKSVLTAIAEKAVNINLVSAERIREELNKILLSKNVISAFSILHSTTLLKYILPEFDRCFETKQNIKYHIYDVGNHSLHVVLNTPEKIYLKYAALLHDIGKPDCKQTDENGIDTFRNHAKQSTVIAEDTLKRLKFDNKNTDKILRLIKFHDREIALSKKAVKRAILDVGEDIFLDLIAFKRAEVFSQNTEYTLPRLNTYDEILGIYDEIKKQNEAISLSDIRVNGKDIIALGYVGKDIGVILQNVLFRIIENPEYNEKEQIIKIIKKNADLWLKEK